MEVTYSSARDGDGDWLCHHGPLIRGITRAANADLRRGINKGTMRVTRCGCTPPCTPGSYVDPAHVFTGQPPSGKRVPLDDQWLAILELVETPTLPAWCDRHLELEVNVAELRHRVGRVIAKDDLPPDRKMKAVPVASNGP